MQRNDHSLIVQSCECWRCRTLHGLFDAMGLTLAWYVTVNLRLAVHPWTLHWFAPPQADSVVPPLYLLLALWFLSAAWLGLYRAVYRHRLRVTFLRVIESVTLTNMLLVVLTFFFRSLGAQVSHSFVLLHVPVSFVVLVGIRYATLPAVAAVQRRWPLVQRIAVLGSGPEANFMIEQIGYAGEGRVAGIIMPAGATADTRGTPLAVLGTTNRLAEVINREQLDRLVIVRGVTTEEEVEHCVRISQRMGVTVSRAVTPFGPDTHVALANRYGMQVMELTPVTFTQAQQHIKRAFDAVVASMTLLLLWPLFLLCVMLVKFSSPGPVLYRSRRVGRGGRHFTFLKFRTMYQGNSRASVAASNEKSGHIFKVKNDPRVTPVGRFLRRFSLDELPQIVNVLLGEMSLVGPRPLPAGDLDPDGMSGQFSFWAEQRARVAPGITGLWQIRGRSAVPFEKMMEFDVEYIRGWSVLADLKILFETPIVVITGLGAY